MKAAMGYVGLSLSHVRGQGPGATNCLQQFHHKVVPTQQSAARDLPPSIEGTQAEGATRTHGHAWPETTEAVALAPDLLRPAEATLSSDQM